MSKKYVNYDTDTKEILGFYDDEIHGTLVSSTYDNDGQIIEEAYYNISTIPTPNFEILEAAWTEAIENGFDLVDEVQETMSIKVLEDALIIENAKIFKIKELNDLCESNIVAGFTSTALGTEHTYQSDRDDQINLMGMVIDNIDSVFKCLDNLAGNTWAYRVHTAAQLAAVLSDGKAMKLTYLQTFNDQQVQVQAIDYTDTVTYETLQDAIDAINAIV